MNKNRNIFLIIGFIAGVTYVSCGGAGGISDTIANVLGTASEVSYDGTSSGLSATTIQSAIDEVDSTLSQLSRSVSPSISIEDDLEDSFVGTWSGTAYFAGRSQDVSLTLNSDGTYSCTGTLLFESGQACSSPTSWSIITRSMLLKYGPSESSQGLILIPTYVSTSKIEFYGGEGKVYALTKE